MCHIHSRVGPGELVRPVVQTSKRAAQEEATHNVGQVDLAYVYGAFAEKAVGLQQVQSLNSALAITVQEALQKSPICTADPTR